MAQSGPHDKWHNVAQMAQSGQKLPKVVLMAQRGPKWSKWPEVAQMAQSGPNGKCYIDISAGKLRSQLFFWDALYIIYYIYITNDNTDSTGQFNSESLG